MYGDHRGYFMETYSTRAFEQIGITAVFVQDNQSFTAQKGDAAGHSLSECAHGAGQARARHARGGDGRGGGSAQGEPDLPAMGGGGAQRREQAERGFGHGFRTLTDDVEFCYKVDNLYGITSHIYRSTL